MVHNGIEYGDMQMICETYQIMKDAMGMNNDEMQSVFRQWNQGELNSYLIEITRDILGYQENGEYVIDTILDTAGQKGTGKWTAVTSLEIGQPVTLIAEAVFARCLSALKEERIETAKHFNKATTPFEGEREGSIEDLRRALYASKIISYAQGFMLMKAAAIEYGWHLDYGTIALIWRAGCIIRSAFLGRISQAYAHAPDLPNLVLAPFFKQALANAEPSWRKVISLSVRLGIPTPAMASALTFFDGYRTERLPANLLQAQRDYFGAHTYERVDKPRGEYFHTNWTGQGGETSASTYTV